MELNKKKQKTVSNKNILNNNVIINKKIQLFYFFNYIIAEFFN